MVRKRLLAFLLVVLLALTCSSCNRNWKKYVSFSELIFKPGSESNTVIGDIKNNTDKYLSIRVIALAKSGTIVEELYDDIKLRPNETKSLLFSTKTDHKYSYEIKEAIVEVLEIPAFDKDNITADALEYYYPELFEKYSYFTESLEIKYNLDPEKKPFIDSITLMSEGINIRYGYDDLVRWEVIIDLQENIIKGLSIEWPENIGTDDFSFINPYYLGREMTYEEAFKKYIRKYDGSKYTFGKWHSLSKHEGGYKYIYMANDDVSSYFFGK